MSDTFVNREDVAAYMVEWLKEYSGQQVGDHDVPKVNTLELPYAIVYLIGTRNDGPWATPDNDMEIVFQITNVGSTPKQTRWMSDLTRSLLIGRDADGDYLVAMVPDGFSVAHRWASGLGAIVKSGDRLYESPDTYRIKVVPQA
jgi:hypothetical protein